MKSDILDAIDAVLAENRGVKRQRMFSKVMDLLDNPTQCAALVGRLLDLGTFDELPGEAERVGGHADYCWRVAARYDVDRRPGTCIDPFCSHPRWPDRLFCRCCIDDYESDTDNGAQFRTKAFTLK